LEIYQKNTIGTAEIDIVLKILNRIDAQGYAQDMSEKNYRQALSELNASSLPEPAKDELKTIAAFLLKRQY
jgi:geranylgeranyl pyrophosphate synthase